MTYVSLSSPTWPTDAGSSTELAASAITIAPRIRLEIPRGVLWADARDLDAAAIATQLLALLDQLGVASARAGIAATPIAAEVAARHSALGTRHSALGQRIVVVPPGEDRAFLASFQIEVLHPPPPRSLYPLLAAVGIECCGDLAKLDRESVEVRFGSEGVRLWQLTRADDPRPIFGPRSPELPSAELEWVDYELDRQEHVVFIVNSLLGTVCEQLQEGRRGAHAMRLEFTLANRTIVAESIRCGQPTADRRTWLRVTRSVLERFRFTAPVVRIALAVEQAAPIADRQGDLFDRGFATARSTAAAISHLLDLDGDAIAVAERCQHPLPERRVSWRSENDVGAGVNPPGQVPSAECRVPSLTMQILAAPAPIDVWVITRRGATVPDRYFDGTRNHHLVTSLGPDRIAGGFGEERFERDYFQCIREDGVPVLLYRDRASGQWMMAGWWD